MDPVYIGSTTYGAHWLDRPAAESWQRMVRDGCPAAGITDAGRTQQEQIDAFLSRYRVQWIGNGPFGDVRWWNGVRYARFQGAAVAVPGSYQARHTYGRALDLNGATKAWVRANGARYGWIKDLVANEDWHIEYQPARDVVPVSNPGTSTGTVPTVPDIAPIDPIKPTPTFPEDDMMLIRYGGVTHVVTALSIQPADTAAAAVIQAATGRAPVEVDAIGWTGIVGQVQASIKDTAANLKGAGL